MWEMFFYWVASFLLTDYFRPKLPNVEPSGEGDFQSPTATEGRKVPQCPGGTVKVKGPNTLWRGDWEAIPVTIETGVVFKRDETVGYQYNIALALGQFMGRAAGITAVYVGDDKVWDYVADNSGNPADVADVNLPAMFGGETKGGGFVARFRCFNGQSNTVSSYLNTRVTNQSAWPGLVWVMMTNLTETGGANIGEQNTLRNVTLEFQTFDTIANGGLGNELSLTGDKHIIGRDANPISAAYRVLTEADWSVSLGDINFANFQAAADTCYNEGIGYSRLVDNEVEAFEILAEIEKHVEGYFGINPLNGLMEVVLARDGYDPALEFQADTTNIRKVSDFSQSEWPQTKNEVKIRFVNREKEYNDDHAVVQDMAGRLIAGRPQSLTIRFPGLRDATAANAIAARTSRAYFWPVKKFKMELDRTAWELRPGSVVVVTWPKLGLTDLATRVIRMGQGDPVKQTIVVDVVEDVFGFETGILAAPQPSGDVPPSTTPVAVSNHITTLAPRWLLDFNNQALEPRLLYLVERDSPNSGYFIETRNRITWTSGNFSALTRDTTVSAFTRYGTLRAALGQLKATANNGTALASAGGGFEVDGDLGSLVGTYSPVNYQGLAVINPDQPNEEWIAVGSITLNGAGIECAEVVRGIGDSAISEHALGEPIWFIDTGAYLQDWMRVGDEDFGLQYQIGPIAQGVEGANSGYSAEKRVDNSEYRKPYPPTAVIFDNISSTVWFADGTAEASGPGLFVTNPTNGVPIEVWNRRFDSTNAVLGANSVDDAGFAWGNNVFDDVDPDLNWFVYDLDTHPNPVRGDEILSGTVVNDDDRVVNFTIPAADIEALELSNPSPINARFEFVFENQATLGDVAAGTESNPVFIDKQISYLPPQDSKTIAADTVLALHFEGLDRTTQVIDYGIGNLTTTVAGDAQVDLGVTQDTGLQPGSIILDGTGDWVNVVDDPLLNLDCSDGFTIQARVYFKSTPSGEIPIVTKWATTGNQRSFWFGLNNTTLRLKISRDGTEELIETTGTRTWTLNTWYEITVVVFNHTSLTRAYFLVDGVFDEHESFAGEYTTLFDSTSPVRIGADADDNAAPSMNIDEVRIVRRNVYFSAFTTLQKEYPGRERLKVLHCNWENAVDEAQAYTTDDLNRMPVSFPTGGTTDTKIDTAQAKFGTNSLHCNGQNSSTTPNNVDGVWLADTGDVGALADNWAFGVADFTMEGFVRFKTLPNTTSLGMALITKYWRTGVSPWGELFFEFDQNNQLAFTYADESNVGHSVNSGGAIAGLAVDTWYHFAVCRQGNVLSLFFDGNRVGQNTSYTVSMKNHTPALVALGRRYVTSSGTTRHRALNGWLDEVRVQCGVAEYDGATYTVPTAAFPVDPLPQAQPPAEVAGESNWQPGNL